MQLIRKYNEGIRCLLWVFDILSIYVWVVLLKDKTGICRHWFEHTVLLQIRLLEAYVYCKYDVDLAKYWYFGWTFH